MNWGYRVMKRDNEDGETEYGIFEVYYDENGNVNAHSKESITAMCETLEDLKYEWDVVGRAFELEPLKYTESNEEV